MSGHSFLALLGGFSFLWLLTLLPRWLRIIDRGRDVRAGSTRLPLWLRVLLRVGMWGGLAGASGAVIGSLALGATPGLVLGLCSGFLGATLGLSSCLELPAQTVNGRLADELGASVLGGLLAACGLVALRVMVVYGMGVATGFSFADSWSSALHELSLVLEQSGQPRGPLEVLTYPYFLAATGYGFGVMLLMRIARGPQITATSAALAPFLLYGLVDLHPLAVVIFALPLAFLFGCLMELCARYERLRWPRRVPLRDRELEPAQRRRPRVRVRERIAPKRKDALSHCIDEADCNASLDISVAPRVHHRVLDTAGRGI